MCFFNRGVRLRLLHGLLLAVLVLEYFLFNFILWDLEHFCDIFCINVIVGLFAYLFYLLSYHLGVFLELLIYQAHNSIAEFEHLLET